MMISLELGLKNGSLLALRPEALRCYELAGRGFVAASTVDSRDFNSVAAIRVSHAPEGHRIANEMNLALLATNRVSGFE